MPLQGVAMEYLPLMIILGLLSACGIAAYEVFDAIERDEYERPSRWSGRARVAALGAAPSPSPKGSSPRSSVEPGQVIAKRSDGSVRPAFARLDVRIRSLEGRLERLERDCDRIEAFGLRTHHVA
jgi:hypothetical protein